MGIVSRRRLPADAGVWTLIVVIALLALALGAGPSLMAPGVLPGMRRHAWS